MRTANDTTILLKTYYIGALLSTVYMS